MSTRSDDSPTLGEYIGDGEQADVATVALTTSIIQTHYANIPTINRERYANAFRRVRYWVGSWYDDSINQRCGSDLEDRSNH